MLDSALILCGALLLAFAVDHWLGEPPVRWYPVVWMGNYLNWAATRLRPNPSPAAGDAGRDTTNLSATEVRESAFE